ncbi:MAG TPA: type IV toxin-antitoxin system AbiEi family antitoxin [Candidatus Dormibacteraeota bacterium]
MPAGLRTGPFSAAEALAEGVQRWHLDTANYRRLGRDAYAWAGLADSPELKLAAALLHLPSTAVFSGLTAAWLHGLDSTFVEPIQVTLPAGHTVKARVGLRISRVRLAGLEIAQRGTWRVTSPVRTILDLSRSLPLIDAVVLADVAVHRRLATLESLRAAADLVPGSRNVQRVRRVLAHVEPKSESHIESRLRMLLVSAGLPKPQPRSISAIPAACGLPVSTSTIHRTGWRSNTTAVLIAQAW